ncbi:hypothetical protein HYDPIDRAFT_102177, partial [Hydnomerulius pinastri MD-312]
FERGLQLLIDGDITLADIDLSPKGKHKIPRKRNKITGKDSSAVLAFSEANWGTKTHGYVKSLVHRHPHAIVSTSHKAQEVAQSRRRGPSESDDEPEIVSSDDERALI